MCDKNENVKRIKVSATELTNPHDQGMAYEWIVTLMMFDTQRYYKRNAKRKARATKKGIATAKLCVCEKERGREKMAKSTFIADLVQSKRKHINGFVVLCNVFHIAYGSLSLSF